MTQKISPQTLENDFPGDKESGSEIKTTIYAFLRKHLQYLGHLILDEGIYPLNEKGAWLVNQAIPTDMTETRQITG